MHKGQLRRLCDMVVNVSPKCSVHSFTRYFKAISDVKSSKRILDETFYIWHDCWQSLRRCPRRPSAQLPQSLLVAVILMGLSTICNMLHMLSLCKRTLDDENNKNFFAEAQAVHLRSHSPAGVDGSIPALARVADGLDLYVLSPWDSSIKITLFFYSRGAESRF